MLASRADADLTAPALALLDGTHVGRVANRAPTLEDVYVELVTADSTGGAGA